MKGVIGFIVIAIVAALAGCQFTPAVTYVEQNDATNDFTAEIVGMLSAGPYSIQGTLSSATDVDQYRVDIGSATTISYQVFYNDQLQSGILNTYPLTITTYNSSNSVLLNHVWAAAASPLDLEPGTAYVVFMFYGTSSYASGSYEVQLQK